MTTFDSGGEKISVELFLPPTGGLHPGVVVAYGTEGMGILLGRDVGAAIRDFAGYLATKGFVALIPHFFERTKTPAGFQTVMPAYQSRRDEWLATLGDCLEFAANRAEVDKNRLGLLGFSLGGHLALRRAKIRTSPAVRAVVEFYAPISQTVFKGLGDHLTKLPPLQIHHGGPSDHTVPSTQSDELEDLLLAAGKRKGVDYERYDYPDEGHGFRGAASIKVSKERTAAFLSKQLGKGAHARS